MISPESTDDSTQQDSSAATIFLLRILTDEIARDGGACLVTTLKDYIIDDNGHNKPLEIRSKTTFCHKSKRRRNQQLNSLLTHSNVGKPKLLAFLESHSDAFEVKREKIPHWVQLVKSTIPRPTRCDNVDDAHRETLRAKVFQKALYVLRKRTARIERRRKENAGSLIHEEIDTGVFCHWLLRQCSWDFHFLLRYCGFYLDPSLCGYETPGDVKQVGCREWEDVALPAFQELLRLGRDDRNCSHLPTISWIRVKDGKAMLQSLCSENEYQEQFEMYGSSTDVDTRFDFIVRPSLEAQNINRPDSPNQDEKANEENEDDTLRNLVLRIDQSLTDIVCRKDGGHQVSLQLVLHRYPDFRELLGGRDLWTLYRDFSSCQEKEGNSTTGTIEENNDHTFFHYITMLYNGGNIILRSKQPKTIVSEGDSLREKRMMVDEEGLYSVTNNKWGRAMSNLVIQACREKRLFGEEPKPISREEEGDEGVAELSAKATNSITRTVIDLTASVGGMTLALVKSNFFDRVLALEIDEGRAALCRENLDRHGFPTGITNGKVIEVRNQDSVEQIPFLPRGACFVIDPPWGGYDYKEKVRRQQQHEGRPLLKLGDTSLEDVLAKISLHNSPCVVGLRLPTNFAANDFLEALRENHEGVEFECLTRRKISVQLFVVLYFPKSIS